MNIEERLLRQRPEDIIYFGDLVDEHFKRSGLAKLLEVLSKGRSSEKLRQRMNGESSDYILGLLKGYEQMISDLEQMLIDRDTLKREKPKRKRKKKETYNATQPGEE